MKVVSVGEAVSVTGGLKKQDIVVCDSTGIGRLTLWEEMIDSLNEGTSYLLRNVIVRQYRDEEYLSMAKSGSSIVKIDDIGNVDYKPKDNSQCRVLDVTVVGVLQLDLKKICINCKGRVESMSGQLGRCSKCLMTQRISRCSD